MPFVIDTPTWRANPDWGAQLGYNLAALEGANNDRAWSSSASSRRGGPT